MKVEKIGIPIEEMMAQERAAELAARAKAVQDYNIMMGNIEDPAEEEDEEDE